MATPSQDDLVIRITAQIDDLQRSLADAQRRLDEFERQNQNAGSSMANGIAKARDSINNSMGVISGAMAAATAAATLLANSAADSAMEINKYAAAAGMSAQEFQFFAAGANAVGLEVQDFGDILKDVVDRMGDFSTTEGGELVDFFETIAPKVGVTAKQFRNLSGMEGLQLFVDTLQKAKVPQDQFVFLMESMAEGAMHLTPLLKDGGAGFKLFGEAAQKAGALMSDEFLDKAAEMKTSMWLLEQSLKGARNQMSEEMLPTIRDLAAQFTDVSDGQSAASKTGVIFSGILRGMATIATGAVAAFDLLGSSIGGVAAGASRLFEGVNLTDGWIDIYKKVKVNKEAAGKILDEGDADIAKKLEDYAESIKKAWGAGTEATKKQLKDLAEILDAANQINVKDNGQTSNVGKKAAEEAKKKAEAAAKELADAKKNAAELLETYKQAAMDEEDLRAYTLGRQRQDLKAKMGQGLITERQYRQGVEDLNKAFDDESVRRTQAALDDILSVTQTKYDQIEAEHKKRSEKIAALVKMGDITPERGQELQAGIDQAKRNQIADEWQLQADADAAEMEQRLAKYEALADMARTAGMTEIDIMTAEHDAKMAMLSELNQQELDVLGIHQDAIAQMEADFAARRLDAMLGSGQAMQNLTDAFQKSQLQGALQFFASDFGGFSQHSRKMFEAMKAAKIAQALLSVPSTTIAAYEAGTKVGGPPVGALYAAAALATQLGNLRQLQSITYGGKSGGGGAGGGSVGGGSSGGGQSQPVTERFVNINLMGNDDTMFSKAAVRSLIERINEETKDGAVLRVT